MRKLLLSLATIIMVFSAYSLPAVAADNSNSSGVETAVLTTCGQDSDGVGCILRLVVDIMSIGIGILGVIGITIVGIQYLTAGGNEEQTRKAKHRMFEIVIGLVAYVVLYAVLRWLLPSFNGV